MKSEIYTGLEEIAELHINELKKGVDGEHVEEQTRRLVKIVELLQHADDEEAKRDAEKEKLAYDNGREDLKLRDEEHRIANEAEKLTLERDKLEFEKEKFKVDLAIRQEANELERQRIRQGIFGEMLRAAVSFTRIGKAYFDLRDVLKYEETGIVKSFGGKKVVGNSLSDIRSDV